jgi:hypothetical protein
MSFLDLDRARRRRGLPLRNESAPEAPDFFTRYGAPRVGPELKPQAGGNPLGDLPQGDGGGFFGKVSRAMNEGAGGLAAEGVGSLMRTRAPELKPDPNGNPLASVSLAPRKKFLGLFGDGGKLNRRGQWALVGDEGPEVAVNKGKGETEIIPLDGVSRFLDAVRRNDPATAPQPTTPQGQGGEFPRPFSFEGVNDGTRAAADNPQGQTPRPSRFASLNLEGATPQTPDDPLTRPTPQLDFERARRRRAERAGVSYDVTGDARQDTINQRDALLNNRNPKDTNGRGRSALKGALEGLALGLASNGIGGGIGGAVTGAIRGAVAPNWDERIDRDREAGRLTQNIARSDTEEKRGLDLEGQRADNRYRDALTDYTQTTKKDEAAAREEDRQKRQLLSMLRSIPSIDPTRHKAFLDRWRQTFGEDFDVDAYNNKKSNFVVRGLITDPAKPQEKHDVAINFADGSTRDLGRSGYVATRNDEGMTGAEVNTNEDRDASRVETHRHNIKTEGQGDTRIAQGQERIGISRQGLTLRQAAQDNRFDASAQKRFDSAAKLAAQAERFQQAAEAIGSRTKYIDPQTGEEKESRKAQNERDKFSAQAQALRRQLFASFPDVFETGADGRVRMTQSEYRSMFPSLGGGYVGDAQSLGVDLYDADKTGQGTPVRSPMHRPARRGGAQPAPSAGKTHVTRADARRLYPQLKDASDADVDAAIRGAGYEPVP